MIKVTTVNNPQNQLKKIKNRSLNFSEKTKKTVSTILHQIQKKGNSAVQFYAKKYDQLQGSLKLPIETLTAQAKLCPLTVKKAINLAIANVKSFHKNQTEKSWMQKSKTGTVLGQIVRPLERIGVYVPGGAGMYPSSVIMNVVPAQIAGVKNIVITTPVKQTIDPATAYAIKKLNISEVYQIGGAQAIGLLAYGTQNCIKVDKIVGPGNQFVALAKKEVFGEVDIDMVAGPSEIMVMADDSVNPNWIAADLLSQAEHGSSYEASILITTSNDYALKVKQCLSSQIKQSPKKQLLTKTLKQFGQIFVVDNWKQGSEIVNYLAPEHLEIITHQNSSIIPLIKNAGAIFVGPYSSEPVGDYFAGPSHVLPTNGSARFFSPLGVYDFFKRTSYIEYSQKDLKTNGQHIINLANAEGFIHHANAIEQRLNQS